VANHVSCYESVLLVNNS